jgi:outer membrane protein TolC
MSLPNNEDYETIMAHIKRQYLFISLLFAVALSSAQPKELSLDECVTQALQKNTNILMAKTDVEFAERKRDEITAKLLPQIFVSADYRYYNDLPTQLMPLSVFGGPVGAYKEAQFGVPHVLNGNIQGTMPIYNQTILSGRTTAALGTELSEYQYKKTREDVVLDVSITYYNAQIVAHQITFLQGNIKNLEQLIATTTLLYQNQMAKQTDADKVKLQKSILDAQVTTADANYQRIIGLLKFQIGISQNDSIQIQAQTSAVPMPTAGDSPLSTEIIIAQKMQQLLQSEMDGMYAARYPTLAVYGVYGTNGYATTGDKSFQKFFPVSFVGLQFSLPLFDGGTISAKVDQKTLELQKAALKEKLTTEKNSMDKTNLQNQLRAHRQTVAMQEENITLANTLYAQTQLQFTEGVANISDVLQADSALRDAQTNYLTALAKYTMTELEWKKAAGILLQGESIQ